MNDLLYIIISTVCFQWTFSQNNTGGWVRTRDGCVQSARISTSSRMITTEETVYTVTGKSEPCKHRWVSEYIFLRYYDKDNFNFYAHTKENHMQWDEYCVDCKKRRRKYMEEKWEVEE